MSKLTRFLTSEWTKRTVVLVLTVFVAIAIRDYGVLHLKWSKWVVTPAAAAMYYIAFALYDVATKPWSWKTQFKEIRRAHRAERDAWAKAAMGAVKAVIADQESHDGRSHSGRNPATPP